MVSAPYLTAPSVQKTAQRTCSYLVELASKQLDHEGVPASYCIVDVVVLENTTGGRKSCNRSSRLALWLNDGSSLDSL